MTYVTHPQGADSRSASIVRRPTNSFCAEQERGVGMVLRRPVIVSRPRSRAALTSSVATGV